MARNYYFAQVRPHRGRIDAASWKFQPCDGSVGGRILLSAYVDWGIGVLLLESPNISGTQAGKVAK